MSWVAVGVAGVGATIGGIEAIRAHKKLKELQKKPLANFSVSPELQSAYDRSLRMAGMGFTPEQAAAYHSNVGMQQNTARANAINQSGGSLSSAINIGLQSQNIEGENKFASEDADKRMRNIQYADNLAGQIQGQRNLETDANRSYRIQQEQQYGLAEKQGIENISHAVGAAGTYYAGSTEQDKQLDMYKKLSQQGQYPQTQPFYPTPTGQ